MAEKIYNSDGNANFDSIFEDTQFTVDLGLKRFVNNTDAKEYEFPSAYNSHERTYVHKKAKELGLKSKSRGKGLNRAVTVYKREGSTIIQADAHITLVRLSRQSVLSLLSSFPVTNKERQDLLPITERDRSFPPESSLRETTKTPSRLQNGVPIVPSSGVNTELLPFRKTLPIWPMRDAIVQAINSHSVVIISGETGCGKTTQVPQFIMEHCEKAGRGCRIICSTPRRLSAVTVSERVALERAEPLSKTVGYQIRLESRVSPHTILTYCTNSILLHTLLCGDSLLATVTHVIIDEIHERDRLSDFMLIVLRDALAKYRGLKLILMSTMLDTSAFAKYFTNCPVISGSICPVITIPGRLHEVQEYFLEDILKKTGYTTKEMQKVKKDLEQARKNKVDLEAWTSSNNISLPRQTIGATPILGKQNTEVVPEKQELEGHLKQDMDRCLMLAWGTGTDQAFAHLLQLIHAENISVDYQHSESGVTALMAAAAHGNLDVAEHLLSLGARVDIRPLTHPWSALDWAVDKKHSQVADLLQAYLVYYENELTKSEAEKELSEESRVLIDVYERCFDDEQVDVDLIIHILLNICESGKKGSVLIFLPSYDYIVSVREKIIANEKKLNEHGKLVLLLLHSKMQTGEQKRVFQPVHPGQRKVILSTNIAETSITIDDVTFVIDSGKVRQKSYSSVTNTYLLRCEWISQACARQRRGRAGRSQPGVCFHLFSSLRYRTMSPLQAPEILREPLQELCLHTKLLAPPNSPIADFLARAIEPPSPLVTRNAVQLLKTMDALDAWEDLTDLGRHLLEIPIEPRFGKMLLFAIILKCLDPILTIVCCLAQGEPFKIPSKPGSKRNLANERKKLANNCFSDHMVYLRVFQNWQQARYNNTEKQFCERVCVSSATMELVTGMRSQVLGQLRASGLIKTRGAGDIRDVNTNSDNWAVVKGALTGGLYPNLARRDREYNVLRTQKEHKVGFHPFSTLRDIPKSARVSVSGGHTEVVRSLPTDWVIYEELSKVNKLSQIRTCTVVSPVTVGIFAGPTRLPLDALENSDNPSIESQVFDSDSESDSEAGTVPEGLSATMKLDDWLVFRLDNEAASLVYQLRLKWHTLLLRRLKNANKPLTPADDTIINSLVSVLTAEEQVLGLEQPQGVGQRPRPLYLECYPHVRRNLEDYEGIQSGDEGNAFLSNIENSVPRFVNQHRYPESSPTKTNQDPDTKSSLVGPPSPMGQNSSNNRQNEGNTKYFVIKAGNLKAVEASMARGVWAFTHSTEKKLLEAYKAGKTVVLVFSLQSSGHFQGYAVLRGDKCESAEPLPEQGNLSCVLPVEWMKRANISFNATRHLVNPYNENNKVQTSRDGQELEPTVGEALCKMWDSQATGWINKNPIHQNSFPGRPIRGRPHLHPHFYRK